MTFYLRNSIIDRTVKKSDLIEDRDCFFDLLFSMTKMERPVFDKFNSATNYSLRILRAIEIIENRKLC